MGYQHLYKDPTFSGLREATLCNIRNIVCVLNLILRTICKLFLVMLQK